MAYYYDGVKCDTLAELNALRQQCSEKVVDQRDMEDANYNPYNKKIWDKPVRKCSLWLWRTAITVSPVGMTD